MLQDINNANWDARANPARKLILTVDKRNLFHRSVPIKNNIYNNRNQFHPKQTIFTQLRERKMRRNDPKLPSNFICPHQTFPRTFGGATIRGGVKFRNIALPGSEIEHAVDAKTAEERQDISARPGVKLCALRSKKPLRCMSDKAPLT